MNQPNQVDASAALQAAQRPGSAMVDLEGKAIALTQVCLERDKDR